MHVLRPWESTARVGASSRPGLSDFTLGTLLGRGATAEVWNVVHRPSRTDLALKVFFRDALGMRAGEHLKNEVRAVAQLDHPSIVQVYDLGATVEGDPFEANRPFVVMEAGRSGTLRDHVGRLLWRDLREALGAVLAALAHAHARGVVHRDIKPSNILVDTSRHRWVLADFGLAHFADAKESSGALAVGTPGTMAPEQIQAQWDEIGPWTDLYSVGCTAWAMLTGRFPFGSTDVDATLERHVHEDPPPLRSRLAVPAGVEAWLRRLLEKDPGRRYLRASHAMQALMALGPPEGEFDDEPEQDPPTLTMSSRRGHGPRGLGLGLWGLRPTPVVGREKEHRKLVAALDRCHQGAGARAVVVRGAAGVGKSRLVEEFAREVHAQGRAQIWSATHGPMGGTHDGLRGMLGRAHGWSASGELVTPADLEPPRESDRAMLQAWLGADAALIPSERWTLALDALRRARSAPTQLVVVDDGQWGLDALGWAHRVLSEQRPGVLFIITVRDEALAELPESKALLAAIEALGCVERLDLLPLRTVEVSHLLRQVLGLDTEAAVQVEGRAAGNPLYAVQLVDHWVRTGALSATSEGFSASGEVQAPSDLIAVWSARVEGVLRGRSAAEITALELAAVLGQQVDHGEWLRACKAVGVPDPGELLEGLVELHLARHLPGEATWTFCHAMLRESLESRCRRGGRLVRAHAVVAGLFAGVQHIDALLRRIHHLMGAEEWAAALLCLDEASLRLLRGCDHRRLSVVVRLADVVRARLGEDADDRWTRIRVREVNSLILIDRMEEAAHALSRLETPSLTGLSDVTRTHVASQRANLAWLEGRTSDAVAIMEVSFAALRQPASLEARGVHLRWLGRFVASAGRAADAERLLLEAAELGTESDRLGIQGELANCVASDPRRLGEAREIARSAIAGCEADGLRSFLPTLWICLGEIERWSHRFDAADAAYEEGARVSVCQGRMEHFVEASLNRGMVALARGDVARARDVLSSSVGLGSPRAAAWVRFFRWALDALAGDWEPFTAATPEVEGDLELLLQFVEPDLGLLADRVAVVARASGQLEGVRVAAAHSAAFYAALGDAPYEERVALSA